MGAFDPREARIKSVDGIAISEKNAEGFTVTFDTPASGKASLDWMLVR